MSTHGTTRPLRFAIGQFRMNWTIAENLAAIQASIRLSRARDADICVFPELAITGFHRNVLHLATPGQIEPAVAQIQALCRELKVAVALGAPTFLAAGRPLNSYLLIDETGALSVISKTGLTEAEATFFDRGAGRPVTVLQKQRCSAVICREIEDEVEVVADLRDQSATFVFWPGLMSPERANPHQNPPLHVAQAQSLARALGCTFIQANWPNALNTPEDRRDLGQSVVISPAGEILIQLPKDMAGTAIFTAGGSRFDWIAQETVVQ